MAILSVTLTRCLASFSFSLFFFQHNPPFIAPFKPKSHTARSWTHRHTHCVLINTCASTNTHCMLVNTFLQMHHSRHQKPLRLWPAPSAHTAHLHGIQLWKRCLCAHITLRFVWCGAQREWNSFVCVCVFSVFWIKSEGKHYQGIYLWSLTYSRDSFGGCGFREKALEYILII